MATKIESMQTSEQRIVPEEQYDLTGLTDEELGMLADCIDQFLAESLQGKDVRLAHDTPFYSVLSIMAQRTPYRETLYNLFGSPISSDL